MRRGGRAAAVATMLVAALAAPAQAWAHAALLRTSPVASATLTGPPAQVTLTYSEAVEPRFAIVSVTDAGGHPQTDGPVRALPGASDTLAAPLRHLPQGWYLVYWRVISADGHPVRGAFTFAVGPNPGPAPQFAIPSLEETAATPGLVAARWAVFLPLLIAAGLLLFRLAVARRPAAPCPAALRRLNVAFAVAVAAGLVAVPVYLLLTTAEFALRSAADVGTLVPLVRDSAFGRAYSDLELVLVLAGLAGAAAIAIDRPARAARSVADLLAVSGAALAWGAALAIPGLGGHAAQTSPAALTLTADWLHMAAAGIWLGGLVGLAVLAASLAPVDRTRVLGAAVPRFSRVAMASVLVIVASGVAAALVHLPTLGSLWQTSYGQTILVKVALLCAALLLGGLNWARSRPRLAAAAERGDTRLGTASARFLRRLVAGEIVLVSATVLAAMVLTSLPPPARALGDLGRVDAHVGPGAVTRTFHRNGYDVTIGVAPNRAAQPSAFTVRLAKGGTPVTGADVVAQLAMLDMEMGKQAYTLPETAPGVYTRSAPALVMVGHWGLTFQIKPRGAAAFTVLVVDHAQG